uniref:T9SS sorting signal type C domain-containing protein n=1 Tax=Flavobacterium denitrificans TaxID=281361 RepID=UPI000688E2EA
THYYATQTVNGCESTSRFDVTATINTTPSAPTGTSGQSFCSGASPTVGNLTATGTAIQWYATSSGGSALATTTALTNGTHYYATQTANGCESTSRLDVTVTITPLPTVSPITGGATTVCTTLTTPAFTNATSGGTWSITPGTGSATIDDATGIVTAGNAGDVTVVYTVTSGSCQNTATATLTIKPNHPAPIVGTITRPTCSALGGSVTLSGLPASGNLFIDNGTTIVSRAFTSSTPTIDQLAPGTYYFALDNGCTAIYSAEVVILANTFTGGTSWTYGAPTSDDYVDFAANYIVSGDETYCSVRVSNGASVTVNSGVTLTVTNGVHVVSGSYLTFKNSSNLIQGNTSNTLNTGNINYERYAGKIRQADYVYWSTPVKNQTLAALSSSTSPSKLYAYDGMKWVFTPRTTIMDPAKGYIVRGPETFSNTSKSDFTGIFIGTPQNGTFAGEPMTAGQPYLLGNPYPSALDADAFITANSAIIEGSLYFWTHNTPVVLGGAYEYETDDYATYNLGGGVGTQAAPSEDDPKLNDPNLPADQLPNNSFPNGQVASGQAFFVKAYAQGSATFTNSMRSSKDIHGNNTNGQFFKPGKASKTAAIEKHRVWLNMTNAGGAFKQLLVAYVEGATNSYDRLYDGKTFDGNKFIDFYSINDNHKLVIQGRGLPFTDADQVPLGYRSTIAGDFTISIDHADGDMKTQAMYIEDKKTGKIHDLKAGKYTFTTEIGTFTDRLVLRYSNKSLGTGDFENVEKGITVSIKDKSVKVLSSNETIQDVTIFDVAGKLLYSKSKVGSNELQISNLQSSNQVLLVDITLDNGYKTTRKIIFQ